MDILMYRLSTLALLSLALLGCEPEIARNTYFCGSDALCPPNLQCQFGDNEIFSYSCVLPQETEDFSCPIPSADQEPDDSLDTALALGEIACGEQVQFENWGCISDGDDIDMFQFVRPSECNGNDPRIRATLRFPVGTAPLSIELLDDAGAVLMSGERCTPSQDDSGTEQLCIEYRGGPIGTYDLRIKVDEQANADCNGTCRFNHYQLVIASPVT